MIPNYLPNEQIAMCRMSQDQAISYWTSTGWMGLTYKNTEIHVEDWAWDIKSHSVCNLGNIANNVLIPSRAGKAVYSVGILYPYPPPKQNTMLNCSPTCAGASVAPWENDNLHKSCPEIISPWGQSAHYHICFKFLSLFAES